MEKTLSFKQWMIQPKQWILSTQVKPENIVPTIVMRLKGHARQIGMNMTANEQTVGFTFRGVEYDPLTILLNRLHKEYGQTPEELQFE